MEFTGSKSIITPEGVFIIGTYDENGVPNAMNAAWGMQSDMGEITLMLSKHKTTENFEKTGAFTFFTQRRIITIQGIIRTAVRCSSSRTQSVTT